MSVAIGTLLWRKSNKAHADHLHVEPPTKESGTPPTVNPGMTPGVKAIYQALNAEFGQGYYFLDTKGRYVGNDPGVGWTHMGGWNRRRIAGSSSWSQHAWWNALDVGPYIGNDQDKFYNFLKGITQKGDDDMAEDYGQKKGVDDIFASQWKEMQDSGVFTKYTDPDDVPRMEELAAFLSRYTAKVVKAEINRALASISGGPSLKGKTLIVKVEDVK